VAINENGRVLVVDDDALIRDTLATALGDEGYAVRVAPDGRRHSMRAAPGDLMRSCST
jgi:DNA-binding response OmpR family regulator